MLISQYNLSDFAPIPDFPKFMISEDGILYNKPVEQFRKASVDKRTGYAYFNLLVEHPTDLSRAIVVRRSRHRLMALTFIKCPGNPKDLVVNHLNGIKGDDRIDNLEWTTDKGNLEHAGAHGLTPKCIPVEIREVSIGRVVRYPSATEAGRDLGLTKDAVLYRLRKGESFVCPSGMQYREGHSDASWVEPLPENRRFFGWSRPVLVKELLTGSVLKFGTVTDAARHMGIKLAALNTRLIEQGKHQHFIPGYYLAKYYSDETPWREVPDPYLLADKEGPFRVVVVKQDATGETRIYDSASQCARALGENPTTINFRLQSNGRAAYKGLRYQYYSDTVHSPLM